MSLAVLSDGVEALSKTLPGSILVLNDGSFRVTSLETPFGTKRAHGLPDICISEKVDVPAKAVKQDWLISSVGSIFMGVMTEGGLSGSQAAGLTIQGQPACIEVAGTTGDAVSQLKVTVQGAAPRVMEMAAALGLLKVSSPSAMGSARAMPRLADRADEEESTHIGSRRDAPTALNTRSAGAEAGTTLTDRWSPCRGWR